MKKPQQILLDNIRAISLVAAPFALLSPLQSATLYWDGGGTSVAWGQTANWSTSSTSPTPDPAVIPGATDIAFFNISTLNNPVQVAINGARLAQGLEFSSTGSVEIRAHLNANTSNPITLGESGIIMNAGAGAVSTISNSTTGFISIRIASDQTWTNNSSSSLTINSVIANPTNDTSRTLTLAGSGSGGIFLNSAINNAITSGTGTIAVTINRPGSTVTFGSAANAYTGATQINAGTLILTPTAGLVSNSIQIANGATFDVSSRSAFTVASGKALGGDGVVTGSLSFASGANFIFNTTASLDVTGTVSFDNSFGVANLVNADGTSVSWNSIGAGSYNLISSSTGNISNVSNFGLGNALDVGGGKLVYFDFSNGDFLLNVSAIPEPSAFAMIGGLAALGFASSRRRRSV